jgi:hypothetical protein
MVDPHYLVQLLVYQQSYTRLLQVLFFLNDLLQRFIPLGSRLGG